jgi:hypothetical protein
MPYPFAFESRPVDQLLPGRRQAYLQQTCWGCYQPVDYAALEPVDQNEYRISLMCPRCFQEILAENIENGLETR